MAVRTVLLDGATAPISFRDVKKGAVFQIIEDDGTLLQDGMMFVATTDAYLDVSRGLWTIETRKLNDPVTGAPLAG